MQLILDITRNIRHHHIFHSPSSSSEISNNDNNDNNSNVNYNDLV